MAETVELSHIMLPQPDWSSQSRRWGRPNWQLLGKFNSLMAPYLDCTTRFAFSNVHCWLGKPRRPHARMFREGDLKTVLLRYNKTRGSQLASRRLLKRRRSASALGGREAYATRSVPCPRRTAREVRWVSGTLSAGAGPAAVPSRRGRAVREPVAPDSGR